MIVNLTNACPVGSAQARMRRKRLAPAKSRPCSELGLRSGAKAIMPRVRCKRGWWTTMEVSRPIIGGAVTCISQEDVSATIALRSSDDG
jgi:hypothetical protein